MKNSDSLTSRIRVAGFSIGFVLLSVGCGVFSNNACQVLSLSSFVSNIR